MCDNSNDYTARTVAAIDTELARVARAIKDEKRLALSLIATINRKDAENSLQIHGARIAMVDACLEEMQRLAREEDALRVQHREANAARLRGLLDECGIVQRIRLKIGLLVQRMQEVQWIS